MGVRRRRIPALLLREFLRGPLAAVRVDGDSLGDRQYPAAEVLGMAEGGVGAESAEKRVLKCVFGTLSTEPGGEQAEDGIAIFRVEALEGRGPHGIHHRCKRRGTSNCETCSVRLAVVGHVEWVEFVRVSRLPTAGEIVHAEAFSEEAGGGGGVAAVRLAQLAGTADFFTALGRDELGRRAHDQLASQGVRLHVAWSDEPQRRAITFIDGRGERTITVIGERLVPRVSDALPWEALAAADGVYFTGGDADALRAARAARMLVATPRILETLKEASVALDALVGSGRDSGESYRRGDLDPPPKLYVATAGSDGGTADPGGDFPASPLAGPVVDTYGAGDSFAAGLTYALASGRSNDDALTFAARCGAAAITGQGAYGSPLTSF